MHQVNDNLAWVLPPRTASRYTRTIIRQQAKSYNGCAQHEIIAGRLEDRTLVVNVRDPYTRLQSYWRLLSKTPNFEDFESYVLNGHPKRLKSISEMLVENN